MEVPTFAAIESEFLTRIQKAVYCSMATVDRKGRPRSRIIHPIWDGPTGWVITSPDSLKAKHLKRNPYVSLAYISNVDRPVYVDAISYWIDARTEKLRIWELHRRTPPPLGFDPQPHYGTIDHPFFGLLRFIPWRIALGDLHGEPIIWRQEVVGLG